MASFAEKLANVVSRHDEISALLSSPDVGADDLVRMNKELAALIPVVEAIHEYNHAEKNMADAKAMMDDSSLDKEMREMAEAEGIAKILSDAGFEWRLPGCSMCLAMNDDRAEEGSRVASTSNRNFVGRQGKGSRTHLMSPASAAAAAIAGAIADPRDYL